MYVAHIINYCNGMVWYEKHDIKILYAFIASITIIIKLTETDHWL